MKQYILGTAIKLLVVLSSSDVDEVLITIVDEIRTVKVDAVAMVERADGVYEYIYQSDSEDLEGEYTAVVEVTSSPSGEDYVVVDRLKFEMIERY